MAKKVMLLGIDGLDWNTLLNYIENVKDSHIKKLLKNSTFGFLKVPLPPLSPAVWITIATGLNRIEHGVLDFINVSRSGNDNYKIKVYSSSVIRGKAIWDKLGKEGYRSIIVNYPFTYPPYKVNGILISGFPSPHNNIVGYPDKIIKKLNKKFSTYRSELIINIKSKSPREINRIVNSAIYSILVRFKLWYYLIKNYDFDFTALVFTEIDRLQHLIFGDERYKSQLIKVYKIIDQILGKILEISKQLNMALIILSDHGFEPLRYKVSVPKVLEDLGFQYYSSFIGDYLKKKSIQKIIMLLYKNRIIRWLISKIGESTLPDIIDNIVRKLFKRKHRDLIIIQNNFSLRLTRRLRKRIDLIKKLLERYSYNNLKPFKKVYTRKEYIRYIIQMNKSNLKKNTNIMLTKRGIWGIPDIILIPNPSFEPTINKLKEPIIDVTYSENYNTGTHYSYKSSNGVFIYLNPNVSGRKMVDLPPSKITSIITKTLNNK